MGEHQIGERVASQGEHRNDDEHENEQEPAAVFIAGVLAAEVLAASV
jgi:hypothetical protein